ncbi:MAG: hypothetical protein WCF04_00710 [Candidatus Nanopelagicales bacterium]
MHARNARGPRWAVMTVWGVVNAVNLLQSVGFATRPVAPEVNEVAGWVMVALAIPATAALVGFVRAGSGWRLIVGPAVYDLFIGFMLVVEDWLAIEFRDPRRPEILIPYLVLFFGSIVLMGAPMLRIDKRLWAVTAATSVLLLGSMVWALSRGVG